jgi:hypothetical protein
MPNQDHQLFSSHLTRSKVKLKDEHGKHFLRAEKGKGFITFGQVDSYQTIKFTFHNVLSQALS